jgi:hypothetical protein
MIPEGDGGEIYFWQYLKDSFSWQRSRGTQILRPKNQFTPTIWYSRGFCSILCFKDVWCLFLFVSACLDSDLLLSVYSICCISYIF